VPGKNLFTHLGCKNNQFDRQITAAISDSKNTAILLDLETPIGVQIKIPVRKVDVRAAP